MNICLFFLLHCDGIDWECGYRHVSGTRSRRIYLHAVRVIQKMPLLTFVCFCCVLAIDLCGLQRYKITKRVVGGDFRYVYIGEY